MPSAEPLNASAGLADAEMQQYIFQLWISVSQFLWWMILVICALTIPILLQALFLMITRYKASNYFHFLTPMIILDMINLCTVIMNLFLDNYKIFNGSVMCRLTAFLTNATMCCVNWLWVMMFTHRFAHIFYSVHRAKRARFRFLRDSRKLLAFTFMLSLFTQFWAPMVMTETRIGDANDNVQATYCSADQEWVNPELYKWLAAAESLLTYLVPFAITVFTDCAVLMFTKESKWFTTISAEDVVRQRNLRKPLSYKIQSEEGMRAAHRRRRHAVLRCLMLATTQLLLNMPNYVLQVVDEFTGLRSKNTNMAIMYLYADALFYGLYMLQFPSLAVFVRLLHGNFEDRRKRRSVHWRYNHSTGDILSAELTRTNPSPDHNESQPLSRQSSHM